jgi:hypothetical protein
MPRFAEHSGPWTDSLAKRPGFRIPRSPVYAKREDRWNQARTGRIALGSSVGRSRSLQSRKVRTRSKRSGLSSRFPAAILVDSRGTLWVKRPRDLYYLAAGGSRFESAPGCSASRQGFTFHREAPDKSIWLSDDASLRMIAGSDRLPVRSSHELPPLSLSERIGNFTFARAERFGRAQPKASSKSTGCPRPAPMASFTADKARHSRLRRD